MFNRSTPRLVRFQCFFDRSNYTVAPDDTVTVRLLIQETFNPRTDESLLTHGTDRAGPHRRGRAGRWLLSAKPGVCPNASRFRMEH
jgi:hypothetical protein